jgi:hypothetical protein
MMGIPVDEPTFFFEDNQSVLANTTNPTSTLKKRLNAIAYHHNNRATLHHQTHAACSLTCWLQSGVTAMPLPPGKQEILDDLAGDAVSAAEYDL